MARLHLLNRPCWIGALLVFAIWAPSGSDGTVQTTTNEAHLQHINASLARWLELANRDTHFLVIDHDADELRLYHHTALLRTCKADLATVATVIDSLTVSTHLRRLRSASPYVSPSVGPFDWERYLSDAATRHSALLLSDETLIRGAADEHSVWGAVAGATLSSADLRALFDALPDGTPVVRLPKGWASGDVTP
jgi:hypothetical protein